MNSGNNTHHLIDVVLLAVAGVVLAKGPHQNHADQADQEDDHHERVEDGEPVNLDGTRWNYLSIN